MDLPVSRGGRAKPTTSTMNGMKAVIGLMPDS
jgi:hypothetical protein